MNPGASYRDSDHISPHPLRRSRKNVIESDPEDDDDVEPPLHKYTRPEGSTPTYNMDTDISTLEAPTFTTLSHKENVLQALKWDHQPTLIGTKVVNPILHVCDKCQHPIIRYGRLNCKHVLCHSCASGLMKEGLNCIRCNTKVTGVEEVGLGRLFVCSYGGSRYGSDGCRRTYLSERDLNAHVDFRHLKQPQTSSSSNNLPSTEAINAATAALAASTSSAEQQNVQSQRGNGDHRSHHKMSRTSNQNQNPNNGGSGHAGHHPPSFSQNQFSQPPPTVMTSAAVSSQNNRFDGKIHGAAAPTAASSSNLITVPIQDNSSSTTTTRENSNEYWTTSKVPIHQPPPNYYNNPGQNQQSSHHGHHGQHQHHHYSTQVSSGGNGNSNYGSSGGGGGNYRTASGYHRR